MTLADYSFYTDDYLGTDLSSANFTKYSEKADYTLKRMTQNRTIDDTYERQYNLAICEIADYLYKNKGMSAKSESLGDYSISYQNGDSNYVMSDIAMSYLGNTGLLSVGIMSYDL